MSKFYQEVQGLFVLLHLLLRDGWVIRQFIYEGFLLLLLFLCDHDLSLYYVDTPLFPKIIIRHLSGEKRNRILCYLVPINVLLEEHYIDSINSNFKMK